jgi:hypothetical protein
METAPKIDNTSEDNQLPPNEDEVTVRGSGFTYTEKQERTDKSIPLSDVNEEEVVPLPDLGEDNHP